MQKIHDEVTTIIFKLDAELKDRFRDVCRGREMSQVLRELVQRYVDSRQVKTRRLRRD